MASTPLPFTFCITNALSVSLLLRLGGNISMLFEVWTPFCSKEDAKLPSIVALVTVRLVIAITSTLSYPRAGAVLLFHEPVIMAGGEHDFNTISRKGIKSFFIGRKI